MNDFAITAHKLGRRFGKLWAVRDLDLQIPKGSAFGLLGPNGSGKTTTINMLMGMIPPTTGHVSVLGFNPVRQDVKVRQRVGYVPEVYGFYEWMKVNEIIHLVGGYHKNWNWERSYMMMKDFHLNPEVKVGQLSKGARAKLALLLALAFEPEMLILDEPTGGLDPAARRNFIETILGHYQESGKTVVVSSHLLNEFSGLLDHVAFMKEGTVQLVSRLEDLQNRMKRARLIFDGNVPSDLQIPDAHSIRINGREAVITCKNYEPEITRNALSQTGAANIVIEDLTLEDIFVELVES